MHGSLTRRPDQFLEDGFYFDFGWPELDKKLGYLRKRQAGQISQQLTDIVSQLIDVLFAGQVLVGEVAGWTALNRRLKEKESQN